MDIIEKYAKLLHNKSKINGYISYEGDVISREKIKEYGDFVHQIIKNDLENQNILLDAVDYQMVIVQLNRFNWEARIKKTKIVDKENIKNDCGKKRKRLTTNIIDIDPDGVYSKFLTDDYEYYAIHSRIDTGLQYINLDRHNWKKRKYLKLQIIMNSLIGCNNKFICTNYNIGLGEILEDLLWSEDRLMLDSISNNISDNLQGCYLPYDDLDGLLERKYFKIVKDINDIWQNEYNGILILGMPMLKKNNGYYYTEFDEGESFSFVLDEDKYTPFIKQVIKGIKKDENIIIILKNDNHTEENLPKLKDIWDQCNLKIKFIIRIIEENPVPDNSTEQCEYIIYFFNRITSKRFAIINIKPENNEIDKLIAFCKENILKEDIKYHNMVEWIDNSIDYSLPYRQIIDMEKTYEAANLKKEIGFKEFTMGDLLYDEYRYCNELDKDEYDSTEENKIYIPLYGLTSNKLHGLVYNKNKLLNSVHKITGEVLKLKDFDLDRIPWCKYIKEKYFDLAKNVFDAVIYDLYEQLPYEYCCGLSLKHKLSKIKFCIKVDHENKNISIIDENGDIKYTVQKIYSYLGEYIDYPDPYDDSSEEHVEYYPAVDVVNDVIKRNTIELTIKEEYLIKDYLKLYLKEKAGKQFLHNWHEIYKNCNDSKEAFLKTKIIIPTVEIQRKLLNEMEDLNKISRNIEKEQNFYAEKMVMLEEYIGGIQTDYDFMEKELHEYTIEDIPQPVASIMYLNDCEITFNAKNSDIFHFFEATAIFHASVLLGILNKINKKAYHKILKDQFKRQKRNNVVKIDFGLWTSIINSIMSLNNINTYFKDKELNQKLADKLDEARDKRNMDYAHSNHNTEEMAKDLHNELIALAKNIIVLLGKCYKNCDIVTDVSSKKIGDIIEISGYQLKGTNMRLRGYRKKFPYESIDNVLDANSIYLIIRDEFIELAPFIIFYPLINNDHSIQSAYFINSIEFDSEYTSRNITHWVSYDCGEIGKLRININSNNKCANTVKLMKDIFLK